MKHFPSGMLAALLLLSASAPGQTGTPNSAQSLMHVDRLRAYFPHADGRGVKVGVVADSVNLSGGLASDQAQGDLPDSGRLLLLSEGAAGNRDEGRAMMHQIYDLAPGVSMLGFATGTGGQQAMANSINALSLTHQFDVIVDAYSYPDEPIFQDGVIAQAAASHIQRGIYISAAGNLGDSSVEEVWRDQDGDDFHEFSLGSSTTEGLPWDGALGTDLNLYWSEPWGRAVRDFDMELRTENGDLLAATSTDSTATRLPCERLTAPARQGYLIVKVKATRGGPSGIRLKLIPTASEMTKYRAPFAVHNSVFTGAGTIVPHAGTATSIAVGSSAYLDSFKIGTYSSRGQFRRLFDVNGNDDSQVFQKPDFIAPDSSQVPVGVFGGRAGFDSTASAAANVAGASALALQLAGGPDSLSQAQLRQLLRLTARSEQPLIHSRALGFGFVDALGLGLAAAGPQPITMALIPNHLGDVDRLVEAAGPNTLGVLRFPHSGSDFVSATVESREIPVSELYTGDVPEPMHLVFDEGAAPFKTLGYSYAQINFSAQTAHFASTSTSQLTTPLGQLVVASEREFTSNQFMHVKIDGPDFPYQTINGTSEFTGFVSPAAPVVYYQILLPADGGPGFGIEVSSQDVDVVLAAFQGRGGLLAESAGATLTGTVPVNDQGFYLAVAGRSFETFGNFTVRLSYQRVPGLPRGGVEFPAVSTEFIPNPVTGQVRFFGRLAPGLDTDAWAVRTAGGQLAAAVNGAFPGTAMLGVGIYDDGQTLIAVDGPGLAPATSVQTEAGRLYLVAGGHGETEPNTDYNVDATMTPPTARRVELLPDRERGEYFRGLFNGSLKGLGDVATFRFTAPPLGSGSVYVGVDNREFVNLNLNAAFQLYNAQGIAVGDLIDNQGPFSDESFTYDLVPGEDYLVQVFGSPRPNSYVGDPTGFGDFRLDVRAYTGGIVPEPDEPNNAIDQALDLTEFGGQWSTVKFEQFVLTDVDFFRIRIAAGQDSVVVRLQVPVMKGVAAPIAPAFVLRDRDGNLIAESREGGDGEQIININATLAPDDYFIEVPGDNTGNNYSLYWEASDSPAILPEGLAVF